MKRIIFCGTRPLASNILQYLLTQTINLSFEIKGVITKSKDYIGWWSSPKVQEVWQIAENNSLNIINEDDLLFIDYDILICVFWGTIFKANVLQRAKDFNINIHTAPLPKYRGCNSYSHALINNEKQYGVTIHLMDIKVDAGDIIDVSFFDINKDDTALSLYNKAIKTAYNRFAILLPSIINGSFIVTNQETINSQLNQKSYYYKSNSLDKFHIPTNDIDKEILKRALFFPPRFNPPCWLVSN